MVRPCIISAITQKKNNRKSNEQAMPLKYNKKFGLILILLTFIVGSCGSAPEETEETTDTSAEVVYGVSTAVDGSGNVYVTGIVYAARDGKTALGDADVLLVKYNSAGTKQWSLITGTTAADFVEDIAIAASGDIYIAGYTYGTLSGETSSGEVDMILMKYDGSGTQQWVKQIGTTSSDFGIGVAVDNASSVYIAGHTYGSMEGTIEGSKDMVLIKYNAAGTQQWIKQLGNDEGSEATLVDGTYAADLAIDSLNNIYVAGFTTSPLDGNTSLGETDSFIVKYDSLGNKLWSTQLGSAGTDYAESIAVDNSGDVLLAGYTSGSLTGYTNEGLYDLFVIKLDSAGSVSWSQQLGSTANDYVFGVAIDQSNDVFLGGHTFGALDGDNVGGSDLLLVKYNSAGTHLFTSRTGTEYSEVTYGVSSDMSDDIFITGYSFKDIDSDDEVEQVLTTIKYDTSGDQQWRKDF